MWFLHIRAANRVRDSQIFMIIQENGFAGIVADGHTIVAGCHHTMGKAVIF